MTLDNSLHHDQYKLNRLIVIYLEHIKCTFITFYGLDYISTFGLAYAWLCWPHSMSQKHCFCQHVSCSNIFRAYVIISISNIHKWSIWFSCFRHVVIKPFHGMLYPANLACPRFSVTRSQWRTEVCYFII